MWCGRTCKATLDLSTRFRSGNDAKLGVGSAMVVFFYLREKFRGKSGRARTVRPEYRFKTARFISGLRHANWQHCAHTCRLLTAPDFRFYGGLSGRRGDRPMVILARGLSPFSIRPDQQRPERKKMLATPETAVAVVDVFGPQKR